MRHQEPTEEEAEKEEDKAKSRQRDSVTEGKEGRRKQGMGRETREGAQKIKRQNIETSRLTTLYNNNSVTFGVAAGRNKTD